MCGNQRLTPMPLKSLIAEATRYARFTMKKSGFLAPAT
jgi:hypothetical protein